MDRIEAKADSIGEAPCVVIRGALIGSFGERDGEARAQEER
jgi:hypothetical protein